MKTAMLKEFVRQDAEKQAPKRLDTKPKVVDNNNDTGHSVPSVKDVQPDPVSAVVATVDEKPEFTYGLHPIEDRETIKRIQRFKTTLPDYYRKLTNFD